MLFLGSDAQIWPAILVAAWDSRSLLDSALLGHLSSVWNMLIHLFVLLIDLAFFIHLVISIFKKKLS